MKRLTDDSGPVRVLLDTSVLRRGHFAGGATKVEPIRLGTADYDSEIHGFAKRPDHKDEWMRSQIRCIPTIARLVREGVIHGYGSEEIRFELAMGRRDEPRIGNVFWGIPLKKARVPVYRSRFIQGGFKATFGKEGLLFACKQLREVQPARLRAILSQPELQDHFDDFEKESLEGIEVFHSICRRMAESHIIDAYHLWTAERNRLNFYCMIEKKFPHEIERIERQHGLALKCKVATPRELLAHLGVVKLDPPPLQEGWFYDRCGVAEPIELGSVERPRFRDSVRKLLRRVRTITGHAG